MSWFLLAWASKSIKVIGIPLSIISSAVLMIPFYDILGPMVAVIVGGVAGFVAFMFHKHMITRDNKFLIITIATVAVSYLALTVMIVLVSTTLYVGDGKYGIGEWSGTADIEKPIQVIEPTYTITEVHCFTNQVIYNDECIYVLNPTDEFPKEMTKYFSIIDDVIVNFCETKSTTKYDGGNDSKVTADRCFEISHYTISDTNEIEFQSTTPPTWIGIRMENLTRYVELGASPIFTIIESGWGNGCTSPTLEVYHMKQEFGHDEITDDDLIYKHHIVYSCPWYESIYPPPEVQRVWDESDFPNFPICEEQGKYLIIGDTGYERLALDYYYCGMENEN